MIPSTLVSLILLLKQTKAFSRAHNSLKLLVQDREKYLSLYVVVNKSVYS